ncbi:unnamed protein product [Urochloa decumbens]|uniref:Uncharacterized protein n=1 Tax=Urochloa decumbens TaxID=240449 RepID=A0ABC9BT08_9POAL
MPAMAAESERPRTRTASMCAAETARGTHSFKIAGHSLHKGLGVGNCIDSGTFSVGGHKWRIRYYPDGFKEESKEYVAVFLKIVSEGVDVRVIFDFRLVNQTTGLSSSVLSSSTVYSDAKRCWGIEKFMSRSKLEVPQFLRDDCLVIECDVTVIKKPIVEDIAIASDFEVQVPPSDMSETFGKFLDSKEIADVTFEVKGEVFHAHKAVLAIRSPVFMAELYGPMRDEGRTSINVEDMEPAVFRALLHFIYRDSLPSMDDLDGGDSEEMIKHLLVAADRYGLERMKLICESMLSKRLDVKSVATTLALADQHHCSKLKDSCIGFINSLNRMDDVLASQGYAHLKRACPDIFMDIWERAVKSRKI